MGFRIGWSAEGRASEVAGGEVRPPKVGGGHHSEDQAAAVEGGSGEVRPVQVGVDEVGFGKPRTAEICAIGVDASKTHSVEGGIAEVEVSKEGAVPVNAFVDPAFELGDDQVRFAFPFDLHYVIVELWRDVDLADLKGAPQLRALARALPNGVKTFTPFGVLVILRAEEKGSAGEVAGSEFRAA